MKLSKNCASLTLHQIRNINNSLCNNLELLKIESDNIQYQLAVINNLNFLENLIIDIKNYTKLDTNNKKIISISRICDEYNCKIISDIEEILECHKIVLLYFLKSITQYGGLGDLFVEYCSDYCKIKGYFLESNSEFIKYLQITDDANKLKLDPNIPFHLIKEYLDQAKSTLLIDHTLSKEIVITIIFNKD